MMDPWLENFATTSFRRSGDTAHDLKTPLNVAVLNLELLRMRLAKLASAVSDPKLTAYAHAIEMELRRMAQIFDTFFVLSSPPKGEGAPDEVDLWPLCTETASIGGFEIDGGGPANLRGHSSRIRQAFRMFFEGASRVLKPESRQASAAQDEHGFEVKVGGSPVADDFEPTKLFKFYYTDPEGNPDLSLASARLIAETYGGEVNVAQDRDKVTLRLCFPLGER